MLLVALRRCCRYIENSVCRESVRLWLVSLPSTLGSLYLLLFSFCPKTFYRRRCLVVRLSNTYQQEKFLFLGGFIAPWSMAGTFGITADSHLSDGNFLLVLTAPLLEWQTSHPAHVQAATSAVTANLHSDQSTAVHTKRARFSD